MADIRFGIVGTGMIANMHAKAIRDTEGARVTAVHDTVLERASAFAADHGLETETDFTAFLARSDIDAVTICTPSGVRADVGVPAARAGKHLFCEKPLEVTLERARRILQACEENGVLLGCVFQARTCKNVKIIKDAIDAGRFGKLIMATVSVPWFRTQEYYDSSGWRGTWKLDGGGALMNQSIHIVDLLVYFLGDPASVSATTAAMTHTGIEVEDTAAAVVRFRNGALGTVAASTCCAPGFPRRIAVYGEKGSAVLEDDRLLQWSFVDAMPEDEDVLREGAKGEHMPGGSGNPTAISHEGHRRQIADFVDAIRSGRSPMVAGAEACRAVALIRGIYEAARSGLTYHFDADESPPAEKVPPSTL